MTQEKTIWIINQYASTPETGFGGRHYYLAAELAQLGYRVYVVAAAYSHLLRHLPEHADDFHIQPIRPFFDFTWIKVPRYTEAHSKKRIFNWFYFSWKLQSLPRHLPHKPDVILYSSPSLVGYLGAEKLARKLGSKLVFEVRDIWPLTLTEMGGYSPRHPFIRLLQWIENRAYRNSDKVVSNLKYAVRHMQKHGLNPEKFIWIPNGFSLAEVLKAEPLPAHIRDQIPKDKFIVGYTGTIGMANALDIFIQAALKLQNHPNLAFVLVGNGKQKISLQAQVKQLGLNNVTFIDSIAKAQVQSMLKYFDVCFIGWKNSQLYQYGTAANKIPEYLFAGKPILQAYSGADDLISEYRAGITVAAENVLQLSQAILHLYHVNEAEREQMGLNGKEASLMHLEYNQLAQKLSAALLIS